MGQLRSDSSTTTTFSTPQAKHRGISAPRSIVVPTAIDRPPRKPSKPKTATDGPRRGGTRKEAAAAGDPITFGFVLAYPETGFGYISAAVLAFGFGKLEHFVENRAQNALCSY